MTLRNQAKEIINFFTGQKSGLPPETLKPSESALLLNFLPEEGKLAKVNGTKLYSSVSGAGQITWLDRLDFKWLLQKGRQIFFEESENSQTFSNITTTYSSEKIFSDKWRDRVYLVNGTDRSFFDGTNLKNLSILPPGQGAVPRPNVVPSSVPLGGSIGAGTYKYTFTYFDSTTETESLPVGSLPDEKGLFVNTEFDADVNKLGWIFYEVVASAGGSSVSFDVNQIKAITINAEPRVDKIRFYRTTAGGSEYFFAGDADVPTETIGVSAAFTDTLADADLGELLLTDFRTPMPSKTGQENAGATNVQGLSHIRFWRDQLWAVGFETEEHTVTDTLKDIEVKNFSSNGILYASDTFLPEYWPFDFEIGRGDGQRLTSIGVFADTLAVYKERSIYVILGSNPSNFFPKIIDTVNGSVHQSTIQETPFGIISLGRGGFNLFDGRGAARLISEPIKDEIANINFASIQNASSSYDDAENRYYLSCPTGTSSLPNRIFVYKVNEDAWNVIDFSNVTSLRYDFGSDNTIKALYGNDRGQLLDPTDPKEVTNDNQTINAFYESGQIDFGDSTTRKRLKWITLTAETALEFNVDINVVIDFAQVNSYSLSDFSSSHSFAVYDTAIYDTDFYSERIAPKKVKIPVNAVGRVFKIQIIEKNRNSNNHSFKILSVGLEATVVSR